MTLGCTKALRYDNKSMTHEKKKSWALSKLKTCMFQKHQEEMRRQATDWEKLYASQIPDKGLVSIICKEFLQHNEMTAQFKSEQKFE